MKEGRRIKTLDPVNMLIPYIMPVRTGASNSFSMTVDITEAEKFLRTKKEQGFKTMNMLHVILAAYVRTVSQLPGINRYIRGQRIYARNGIKISMSIKKKLTIDATETEIELLPNPSDTLDMIYNQFCAQYEKNIQDGDTNNTDFAARLFSLIPGVFLKFVIWALKTLDYFSLMPKAIVKLSPFHGSMYITSMASLGIEPIYHHLYDFGNIPLFICMGKRYDKTDRDGTKTKAMDINMVCDERICDGFYYSRAVKMLKRYIENPVLLDTPPEKVIEDIK